MRTAPFLVAVLSLALATGCGPERLDGDAAPAGSPPPTAAPTGTGAAPSATATPGATDRGTPAAGRNLRKVDWRNATIEFPKSTHQGWETHCMTGRLTFKNGSVSENEGDGLVTILVKLDGKATKPSYGDLTGDGTDEAVVAISCAVTATTSCDGVVVVGARGDKLAVLDYAYGDQPEDETGCDIRALSYRLDGRRLLVTVDPETGDSDATYTYEWKGSRLVRNEA